MSALKHIIVTGSNKGIGYAIANRLAAEGGWNVIMAVRNSKLGESSLTKIQNAHPKSSLSLEQLDVSDPNSVASFAARIKDKHGRIDALVNNAGVQVAGATLREDMGDFNSEVVDWTLQTNFYGTMDITERMLPVLRDSGKIVTVGSYTGRVAYAWLKSDRLKQEFKRPDLTKQGLIALMQEFQRDVREQKWQERGWPRWAYGVSKLGINIYMKIFAQHQEVLRRQIQAYSCCVGYVKTDMTSHDDRAVPLEEGINTPMHLINLPFQLNKELQGGFFEDEMLSSHYANINNLERILN